MSSAVLAFGRNDLTGIRRDPMLRMLVVAPFVYVAMVRFPLPPLTDMLRDRGFDLIAYYPLIVSFFLVAGPAAILSALGGLTILEEKDTGTLGALRVTPVSMTTYAAYRCATIIGVTALYAVVCTLLSGVAPEGILPGLLGAALCAGLLAAMVATLMALVAGNKVEGLALARALGMLITLLPVLPYFFSSRWELLFGLLPAYWPNKIYWVAADGGNFWPYLAVGACYNVLLLSLLIWAFNRRHP